MKPLPHLVCFVLPRRSHFSLHCNRRTIATSFRSFHDLESERLVPPLDRELYDFYRDNFSWQRNRWVVPSLPRDDVDDDTVYVLRKRTVQKEIVAALRITRSDYDKNYTLLRSLCCARECRKRGLGMHLLQSSLAMFDTHCYCFASSELCRFYEKAGFVRIPMLDVTNSTGTVPKWMMNSYKSMAEKWNQRGKSLDLFIRHLIPSSPVHIILLQHCSEFNKSTATGWLVDDTIYDQSIGATWPTCVPLEPRVHHHRWVWSGRNDTTTIEIQINELCSNFRVFLLWTGQIFCDSNTNPDAETNTAYIILDGTWQQAQTMFRKIPILWNLPRISLGGNTAPSSEYILRKDYTGWRERFGTRAVGGGGNLLCTAEVIAAVLDMRGDVIGANEIRCRLDLFQRNYSQIEARRRTER